MFKSTIKDVAQFFNVSAKTVKRWIDHEMLERGVHYIDVRTPDSKKACLRFDVNACADYFTENK
jgi:hypothetical protein